MNPDLPEEQPPDDWLEDALRSRTAMTGPENFSATVMERLSPSASPRMPETAPWIEDARYAGLAFAVLGTASVLDVGSAAEWLSLASAAPVPLVIAGVALLIAGVFYSASAANAEPAD